MNEIITNEMRYKTANERIEAFSASCKDKGGISGDGRDFLRDFLNWLAIPNVEETKERTNEVLAAELLETVGLDSPGCTCDRCETVREAAARLKNHITLPDVVKIGNQIKDLVDQNADLRRLLNVAEDALVVCRDGMCGECHRQHPCETCVNGCYEMSMAKNAIAAIREEKEEVK